MFISSWERSFFLAHSTYSASVSFPLWNMIGWFGHVTTMYMYNEVMSLVTWDSHDPSQTVTVLPPQWSQLLDCRPVDSERARDLSSYRLQYTDPSARVVCSCTGSLTYTHTCVPFLASSSSSSLSFPVSSWLSLDCGGVFSSLILRRSATTLVNCSQLRKPLQSRVNTWKQTVCVCVYETPTRQRVMWLSCDYHVTVMWLSCESCDYHVTVMWLSCDCHVTVVWQSHLCVSPPLVVCSRETQCWPSQRGQYGRHSSHQTLGRVLGYNSGSSHWACLLQQQPQTSTTALLEAWEQMDAHLRTALEVLGEWCTAWMSHSQTFHFLSVPSTSSPGPSPPSVWLRARNNGWVTHNGIQ